MDYNNEQIVALGYPQYERQRSLRQKQWIMNFHCGSSRFGKTTLRLETMGLSSRILETVILKMVRTLFMKIFANTNTIV